MTDEPFAPDAAPAPGWYHADGDPPDTHRYWDGSAWQGGPRPVLPTAAPSMAPPPGVPSAQVGGVPGAVRPPDPWPGWVTTVAWVITVLKAIPLVLGGIGALFVVGLTEQIDEELQAQDPNFDVDLSSIAGVIVVVIFGFLLVGAFLLIMQQRAASQRKAGSLMAWAIVLAIIDGLLFLGSLGDGGGSAIFGLLLAGQIALAVGAHQARSG